MSASEPIESSAPTAPLEPAAAVAPMAGLGFDALEERLRELRESLGLGDASSRDAAPVRAPSPARAPAPAPAPAPSPAPAPVPRPVREARTEVVLRTPRIGWDLVGLAVGWAGLIGLLIGLVTGPLG